MKLKITSSIPVILFLSILISSCAFKSPGEKPNVLLIITDDQGYGDLSCHGNPILKTPNIDQLYAESTRLTDFHVAPTCTPTRAALLTGQHANRTGCWHTVGGRSQLREGTTTIANTLKNNGYKTGVFGKWHLGDNYPFRPQDRGFDEVLVHGGGGVGQQPDYWNNSYFADTYFYNGKPKAYKGYCTDVWFREASKFITEKAKSKEPFFCYLSTNAPHGPYNVLDSHSVKYKDIDGVVNPYFYGMVDNIDYNVGKILETLETLNIDDNTIVIFMTDNGVGNGGGMVLDSYDGGFVKKGYNAGMRGCKGSMYEGGHRVPFFIRWPNGGIQAGKDIEQLAGHIDVLPTLLEAVGISDDSHVQKVDGLSLWDVIQGKTSDKEKRVLITDSQRIEYPKKWRKSATMQGKWRLINGEELYNLEEDPEQRNDISEMYPDKVAELRSEYDKWWEDIKPSFDHYPAIYLGSSEEPVVIMNTMDMHVDSGYAEVPWHQNHIRTPIHARGWYAVNFVEEGKYKVTLYRWPPEAQTGINSSEEEFSAVPNSNFNGYVEGQKLEIKKASVQIGEEVVFTDVDGKLAGAELEISVKAGRQRLRAEFINNDEVAFGAYYLKVEKL